MIFDRQYLDRLRDGDPETERQFVSYFSNLIRRSLRYRLRSWELIEDIRQETFLRVLNFVRSDRSLDRPEHLSAYVHSVCINVMMELLRTRHLQDMIAEPSTEQSKPPLAAKNDPAKRKQIVRLALADFSEQDLKVLRAVFLDETDKSEICERFRVNDDYIRMLVHRAKARFRQAFDEVGNTTTP